MIEAVCLDGRRLSQRQAGEALAISRAVACLAGCTPRDHIWSCATVVSARKILQLTY